MDTVATHTRALAAVEKNGAAVTFSRETAGTLNPATGRYSAPVLESVPGKAVQAKADVVREFVGGEAIEQNPLFLLFVPSTLGQVPPLGGTVTWSGDRYSVKRVREVAPAGTAIASYVVLE